MGRAMIIGGGEAGLYSASIQYDNSGTAAAIAAINTEIAQIDAEVETLEGKMEPLQAELDEKTAAYEEAATLYNQHVNEAIEAMEEGVEDLELIDDEWQSYTIEFGRMRVGEITEEERREILNRVVDSINAVTMKVEVNWDSSSDGSGGDSTGDTGGTDAAPAPTDEDLRKEYKDMLIAEMERRAVFDMLTAGQKLIDLRKFRKEALLKRKAELQSAGAAGAIQDLWCADYTTDLTGPVDSIEINGAPSSVILAPGGVGGLRDANDRTGKLVSAMGMSPAGCALAWAMLPGWQRWMPTYRVGVIHDIVYERNTCSVTLDEAASAARGLEINYGDVLTGIRITYMDCHSGAFAEGDRVVVEFPGQTWGDETHEPRVIGFESHPKTCGFLCFCGSDPGMTEYARVIKLSPTDGSIVWVHDESSGTGYQIFLSCAVTATGDVYAGARSGELFKLSKDDGSVIWSVTMDGPVSAVAVTPSGGVVCGLYAPNGVVALDPGGFTLWSMAHTSTVNDLVVDRDGTVYAGLLHSKELVAIYSGTADTISTHPNSVEAVAINDSGALVYAVRPDYGAAIDRDGNSYVGDDRGLVVDSAGVVYRGTRVYNEASGDFIKTIAYSDDGWAMNFFDFLVYDAATSPWWQQ